MIGRVIDFETTGLEPPDAQICEVGICDVDIESKDISDHKSWLCSVDDMPTEVRAIHHISMGDCIDAPAFKESTLYDKNVTVIIAHNSDFECKFISPEVPVICTYKSALRVWPDSPSHSNGVLRYWLEDKGLISINRDMAIPTHRAGPDAYVTAHIFVALLNAGITGKEMVKWTKEYPKLPRCTIGKFRGKPWSEVELGFLTWMLKQADMDSGLKWNAKIEIERRV